VNVQQHHICFIGTAADGPTVVAYHYRAQSCWAHIDYCLLPGKGIIGLFATPAQTHRPLPRSAALLNLTSSV
jgi:hypothetical protein